MSEQHLHGASLNLLLADAADELQALPYVEGFERMLDENLDEQRAKLKIADPLEAYRLFVPEDIHENHGMPSQFLISDFAAQIHQLGTHEQSRPWVFNASYRVDGNLFALSSNDQSARLTTRNAHGEDVSVTTDAQFTTRLLSVVGVGTLIHQGLVPSRRRVVQPIQASYPTIEKIMADLGRTVGQYQSRKKASLSCLAIDRAVSLTLIETESPGRGELNAEYRLGWEMNDGNTTEITISTHDIMDRAHRISDYNSNAIRRPIAEPPDQLAFGLHEDSNRDPNSKHFINDTAAFGHCCLAALQVLRPALIPYAKLESNPPPSPLPFGYLY